MQYILEARDLAYSYESGGPALESVTVGIRRGKKTVVLGPNGSGKSTLFLHMNGVLRPKKGGVYYGGEPIRYDNRGLAALRQKVGLVFQNPDDQIFAATVEEDVAFGPLNLGLPRDEAGRLVDEALGLVEMAEYRRRPTQQLSFGQRKRVALAGALAMSPEVLLMDEPTAGLDAQIVREVLELTDELNYRGRTIAISTHDVDLAYEWADDIVLLAGGSVLYNGDVDGLFEHEELLHAARLTRPILYSLNLQRHLRTGAPATPRPRTVPECCQAFFGAPRGSRAGTLYMAGPDGYAGMRSRFRMHNRGAYGAAAKRASRGLGLDIHHYFNAVEHGLAKAGMGEDYLVLVDEAQSGLVADKAARFSERTGCPVNVMIADKDVDRRRESDGHE